MVQPPPAAAARRAPGRARRRPAAAPRHPRSTSPRTVRATAAARRCHTASRPAASASGGAVPSRLPRGGVLQGGRQHRHPTTSGPLPMPQPGHDQHRQPDDDACWHEQPGMQRGHQCAHQAASCSRALTALRPACPAHGSSGSSPRPPHHGAQLGDLVHAERDHPALVGSVRPHPDEQTRRAVIAGVLPHPDVARDPLVTDWLARLALPVRAAIIQLWSLAVLDQLRLVRSPAPFAWCSLFPFFFWSTTCRARADRQEYRPIRLVPEWCRAVGDFWHPWRAHQAAPCARCRQPAALEYGLGAARARRASGLSLVHR